MVAVPRPLAALCLLTLIGACLPYTLYHQPGASPDTALADEVACGRIALAQAPVAMEREWIPGDLYRTPDVCDAQGKCRPGRLRRSPPELYTRDVNENLRGLIARQCMADRGYQRVTLPACPDAVRRQVTPTLTRVMPALTPRACMIRRGTQGYQIVPG